MIRPATNVLLVDEGNSFVKWAIFNSDLKMISGTEKSISARFLNKLKKENPSLDTLFISSVRKEGLAKVVMNSNWKLLELNTKTKLPFKNLYRSPNSLGADRKALVSAACNFYPKNPVLIIGAGTCITYDIKDAQNNYYGGAISPGLQMRLDAMSHFTSKLPSLNALKELSTEGSDTHSAMFKGALEGLLHEVNGFIDAYRKEYGTSLKVMLTGGDALRLESYLKRRIFVEPQLVLYGLLSLYELNQKK